ncbi:histidine phosphatase family protein [Algicella marina]|nr:histidine phosphatase family protein [Algicella marina]
MGEIILVRHGQASFGAADYDKLSPLGHEQSEWLGSYFADHDMRFDTVFRGDLLRHRETFEGIASRCPLPEPRVDARFNELNYDLIQDAYLVAEGHAAPRNREEFLHHFPLIFEHWAERQVDFEHETFNVFAERVENAMRAALVPDQTTLIVTSGGVIGVALRELLGLTVRKCAELILNIHNSSIHRLRYECSSLRLAEFNACPHLAARERTHARTFI